MGGLSYFENTLSWANTKPLRFKTAMLCSFKKMRPSPLQNPPLHVRSCLLPAPMRWGRKKERAVCGPPNPKVLKARNCRHTFLTEPALRRRSHAVPIGNHLSNRWPKLKMINTIGRECLRHPSTKKKKRPLAAPTQVSPEILTDSYDNSHAPDSSMQS